MKLDLSKCPTCPTASARDSGTVMEVELYDLFGPLFPGAYPLLRTRSKRAPVQPQCQRRQQLLQPLLESGARLANLQSVTIGYTSDIIRRFTPRTGIGVAARIVQATEVVIPHLSFDNPGILRITHGKKRIRYANRVAVFDQGDIALFGGGYSLDVINEPGDSGVYRAEAIFFDREFLSPRPACPDRVVDGHATIQGPGHSVATALSNAIDAMENSQLPDPVVAHRVNEVMIWLSVSGYYLAAPPSGDLPARVRQLLASDPSRYWPAVEVARAMATSEPTLRRDRKSVV